MEEIKIIQEEFIDSKDIHEAIKAISLKKCQKDQNFILFFRVVIDDDLPSATLTQHQLKELGQIYTGKSVIILLESKNFFKFSLMWKSNDIDFFFKLNHYSKTFVKEDQKIYNFIAAFIERSMRHGHLGKSDLQKKIHTSLSSLNVTQVSIENGQLCLNITLSIVHYWWIIVVMICL